MDSLPYFDSLADRYEEQACPNSELINKRIAQKIEQGIGRGVRGEKDYCAILIIGSELVRFMRSIATNKFFSPQTRKQIDIGIEIADMAKEDKTESPIKVVLSLIKQMLVRDEGWKEYYASEMDTIVEDNAESQVYDRLLKERQTEQFFCEGEYEKAISSMQRLIDGLNVDDTENYTKVPCGTLCSTQHRINESAVLTLVSDTLRAIAEYSRNDRTEFIHTVQETQVAQQSADISKKRRRLAAAQKRAGELEKLICKIYEDNALGKLPDARYKALDAQYAKEQDALEIEIAELEKAVTGYEQSQKSAEKFIALIDKYENFDTLTNTMLNEFVEKILVHERARKGSQNTTQEIEIYFNFLGRYIPPSLQPVPLTPEEQEELQKKEERKDRLHQNYLKRKASGAQKQYEDKIKAKKKAEMDAKKALIRAEDMKMSKLTYIRCGDYDIPNLKLSEQPETSIGKYGRMRKSYLKEHRPILYNHLLMSEKLYPHLLEIERTAQGRVKTMLPHMMEVAGVTEELKACDSMRWVGLMNTLKAQAEEIIQDELIYK